MRANHPQCWRIYGAIIQLGTGFVSNKPVVASVFSVSFGWRSLWPAEQRHSTANVHV
jgi:hypothetical protein